MSRLRIIAFTGPKYSGKDTAAKALTDLNKEGGYLFRRAPMAQGVKNIVSEVFGWSPELFEDPILKEKPLDVWPFIEPRWPLMDIANFMRDKYGGHVWPRWWERQARAYDMWAAHVITDLRFPEELEMLQSHQSLIIYVDRAEAEIALSNKQGEGDPMALNPSEAHYSLMRNMCHAVADNNGSVGHLRGQIQAIVRNAWGYWGHWDLGEGMHV